ncbi:uncharacterized protein EI97DRAFT_446602 [Westerdykella ornata]|uniref:Uncharacterized protein n=1 Tax=Westerdykella ornata TaxID=318751 RepID=A0A6A6J738_WESOR|nr:uncharacterized protein EI97DRAFT_446602 [Westerdykella ornata]KAF2271456.1 hypothetical protein EI97DRAFT_446602 [Westerdykella ornata]
MNGFSSSLLPVCMFHRLSIRFYERAVILSVALNLGLSRDTISSSILMSNVNEIDNPSTVSGKRSHGDQRVRHDSLQGDVCAGRKRGGAGMNGTSMAGHRCGRGYSSTYYRELFQLTAKVDECLNST